MQKRSRPGARLVVVAALAVLISAFTASGLQHGAVTVGGCFGAASAEAGWVRPDGGTPTGCN